jgi:hypothetical protein
MRWSVPGAQAILTPCGWDQSERFDQAGALVAATFQADITVLANVIALKPQIPPRNRERRRSALGAARPVGIFQPGRPANLPRSNGKSPRSIPRGGEIET